MASQLSGIITIAAAGTAQQFTTDIGGGTFTFKAIGANTGTYCYVGNDGADDVSSANGYQLKKGVDAIPLTVHELSDVWGDSDTSGDKICWIRNMGEGIGIAPPAY